MANIKTLISLMANLEKMNEQLTISAEGLIQAIDRLSDVLEEK